MDIGSAYHRDMIYNVLNAFGAMFNQIYVERSDTANNDAQVLKVPIRYGPKDKQLARVNDNPDLVKEIAISYPRMSYELLGVAYDSTRALNKIGKAVSTNTNFVYNPVPYNIGIGLYIVVKNAMDGFRIVEQILPAFNPTFNLVVNSIDGVEDSVPVTLGAVTNQDNWTGVATDQREIVWTLNFSAQAYIYGPNHDANGIIKQIITNLKDYNTGNHALRVSQHNGDMQSACCSCFELYLHPGWQIF